MFGLGTESLAHKGWCSALAVEQPEDGKDAVECYYVQTRKKTKENGY